MTFDKEYYIMQPLDNPAWNALTTLQTPFSLGSGRARRFKSNISPIAGLEDAADPASWAALSAVADSGPYICIFNMADSVPMDGWTTDWRYTYKQMTITKARYRIDHRITGRVPMRQLTLADGSAMMALAALAKPGPMELQTVSLGTYFGIFDEAESLVAMAGERMRFDGATEVSGVCTHPAHRGKRYAQLMVAAITENVLERGDTAFLHVREDNLGAASVYEKLGFETRKVFDIAAVIKRK